MGGGGGFTRHAVMTRVGINKIKAQEVTGGGRSQEVMKLAASQGDPNVENRARPPQLMARPG